LQQPCRALPGRRLASPPRSAASPCAAWRRPAAALRRQPPSRRRLAVPPPALRRRSVWPRPLLRGGALLVEARLGLGLPRGLRLGFGKLLFGVPARL